MNFGLFIGRFQPVHLGHVHVIKQALEHCDKLIIGIGSANTHVSQKNPFTADQRIDMLKLAVGEHWDRIVPIKIDDMIYNDVEWINHIHTQIDQAVHLVSDDSITLFGHSKDSSSYYLKIFPEFKHVEISNFHNISATSIRNAWFNPVS